MKIHLRPQADLLSELILYIVMISTLGFIFASYVIMTAARQSRMLVLANHELNHIACHDNLTGLPNRMLLIQQLEITLSAVKRKKSLAALMFIDLDNFKPINDCFGHEVGDQCLKELSQRMSKNLRRSDILGRLGGDEFLLVLTEVESPDQATAVAQKLIEVLSTELSINGCVFR